MKKLTEKTELKIGMVLKRKITDSLDKYIFGSEVVFRIEQIRGYVFGRVLSEGCKGTFAFHITPKDLDSLRDTYILNYDEAILYDL